MTSKAIVLGCGPAGLMAAHAALMGGFDDVRIYSKPRKSYMNGAQYLHAPIPGITNVADVFNVEYQLWGSTLDYRTKVYDADYDGTVSPQELESDHLAWDIRKTYDSLWSIYKPFIRSFDAGHDMEKVMGLGADLVVSSIPLPAICNSFSHGFKSTKVWSGEHQMIPLHPDNTVVCNGNASPAWYRSASIQGHVTTEWPQSTKPPVFPLWEVEKPVATNCDCWPSVLRVGRYGSWRKGVLSHQAYGEVLELAQAA